MEYSINTIDEFYKELDKKPNAKILKMIIYNAYKSSQERMEKEQAILDALRWENYSSYITLINDEMGVITHQNKKETVYQPWVKDRNRNRSIFYNTFDEALLACISIKHTGYEFSADYMYKLIKD